MNKNLIIMLIVVQILLFIYGLYCTYIGDIYWSIFHIFLNTIGLIFNIENLRRCKKKKYKN